MNTEQCYLQFEAGSGVVKGNPGEQFAFCSATGLVSVKITTPFNSLTNVKEPSAGHACSTFIIK